jgi:hypothetical protein
MEEVLSSKGGGCLFRFECLTGFEPALKLGCNQLLDHSATGTETRVIPSTFPVLGRTPTGYGPPAVVAHATRVATASRSNRRSANRFRELHHVGVIDGNRTRETNTRHWGHNPAQQTNSCLDHSTPDGTRTR